MKIGFLGAGQIGSSWISLYRDVLPEADLYIRDPWKSKTDSLEDCEIVHLCIPCTSVNSYLKDVKEALNPDTSYLVLVHSTAQLGTCEAIAQAFPNWSVAHVPVRGVHPFLRTGIEEFKNYVGETKAGVGVQVVDHLKSLGLDAQRMKGGAKATELSKMMSTTYYGVCLAFHAEMKEMCKATGVDYAEVVVDWNHSYNEGYGDKSHQVHRPNVVRPVFDRLTLPIGGHCVGPNAKLLENIFPDAVAPKWIKKYTK